MGILFIAGAMGIIALTGSSEVLNTKFDSMATKDVLGNYSLNKGADNIVLNTYAIPTEREIIVEMHEMANNYIIADEIRGKREMTQERLNALILILLSVKKPNNYPHKAHLLDMLSLWKQGEFFVLVNDHNYLWDALDGTIGRATGVKKDLPAWTIGD